MQAEKKMIQTCIIKNDTCQNVIYFFSQLACKAKSAYTDLKSLQYDSKKGQQSR